MKIISFDVGIRNMAYCILDGDGSIQHWGILNLAEETIAPPPAPAAPACCMCKNRAKMALQDGRAYCMKHTEGFFRPQKGLSQMKKADLAAKLLGAGAPPPEGASKADLLEAFHARTLSPLGPPPKAAAGDIGLVEIGRRLAAKLSAMDAELQGLTHVVIENQISPIATRMKTIQGMLAQYFIVCFPEAAVEFVSSHNKLKDAAAPAPAPGVQSYAKNKKMSVERVEELVVGGQQWRDFFRSHAKRDDLADCLLQGLWFVRKINS